MKAYYNDNDAFACESLRGLMAAGLIPDGEVDNRSICDVRAEEVREFRQAHFFAGVGGWPLALRWAGWGERAVWTGGCPCQPFSCAGKREGEKDERHLWPEFFRLVRECRPGAVLGEQVASAEVVGSQLEAAFIVAVQNGDFARANKLAKRLAQGRGFHWWARWLDGVQADLAGAGYAFRFTVLGAHSVGAPHIRQRVFWMAHASRAGGQPDTGAVHGVQGQARGDERIDAGGGGETGGLGLTDGSGPQPWRETAKADGYRDSAESAGFWSDYRIVWCDEPGGLVPRRIGRGISALAYGIPTKRSDPRLGYLLARLGELGFGPKAARRILREARANRIGRLKGYGNAIVPAAAAKFVKMCMADVEEHEE